MAVLVTRPQPDDEATALSLRARGFEVLLAPMLRFEPVAFRDDGEAGYGAVVAYAKLIGDDEGAHLLQQTLDEEAATDEKLTDLAESVINVAAANN